MKHELLNVISGKSQVRYGAIIQTIASYLRTSKAAGTIAQDAKHFKEQEKKRLKDFLNLHNLWVGTVDFSQYVSEGAEQRVYLKDAKHVIKLNDAIYYSSWEDYFYNLLLHNYFFPDTAYELVGFTEDDSILYAIVRQSFVMSTSATDLNKVKEFLRQNGFFNNRNNDYLHKDFGIILEDLHDENVLTQNGVLYFIDTVFYLTDIFWTD